MIVVAAVAAVIVVGLLHEQQTVCFVGQGLNSCPAHTSQSEISHTSAERSGEGGAGKITCKLSIVLVKHRRGKKGTGSDSSSGKCIQ